MKHESVYRSVALDAEDTARISSVVFGAAVRALERDLEQIPPSLAGEAKSLARDVSASLTDAYNALLRRSLEDMDCTDDEARARITPLLVAFRQNLQRGMLRRTLAWATKRAQQEKNPVIAFDLDNCALQWQKFFVPVAQALHAAGCKIGVLTGNRSTDEDGNLIARQTWDEYGYPEPAFWEVHDKADYDHIVDFKIAMCRKHNVSLLFDDFKQGSIAERFRTQSDQNHLGLQVLLPPGTKPQRVGYEKGYSEQIERINLKFDVPVELVPTVSAAIASLAAADPYDPDFRGQEISSVYFDTETELLLEAKKSDRNYLTLRLRHYLATDAYFLEAKTSGAKFRTELTKGDAAAFLAGESVADRACLLLPPDLAAKLLAVSQREPLFPCVTVDYRRYARESGDRRLTLDLGLRSSTGRTYPGAVLELKFEGGLVDYPEIDALDLTPIDLSKFTWAMARGRA